MKTRIKEKPTDTAVGRAGRSALAKFKEIDMFGEPVTLNFRG